MYRATTRSIQVSVKPHFLEDRSDPDENRYFWAYTIEVTNMGPETVQLISRHWIITDAAGHVEEVEGLGVVGEQPVLGPAEAFEYTSGVPLRTPTGIMTGSYLMQNEHGERFEIEVPAFSLDSPHAGMSIN